MKFYADVRSDDKLIEAVLEMSKQLNETIKLLGKLQVKMLEMEMRLAVLEKKTK